jgi:hypothetical protein
MIGGELGTWIGMRLVGAICGAALALAFMPPRSWGGFARRLLAALIGGVVFASEIKTRANFVGEEGVIAGACVAAFLCWPAMGVAMRLLRAYQDSKA